MGRVEGKVAFVTGAARGQGRSHAVRLAQEGADIIAVDLCSQVDTVPYPMSTPADLAETVRQVEALDRRIVASQADVRNFAALRSAVDAGVAQLDRLDIVCANAGIFSFLPDAPNAQQTFADVINTNLVGVWNTVEAALPALRAQGAGSAIVLTSSTAGLKGIIGDSPGGLAYTAAKHGVVGLMRSYANLLGPEGIRVNSVHPTGVNTPMVVNEAVGQWMATNPAAGNAMANLLPVEMIEPVDISNAIVWLVSDEARYVTGVTLPVDAGFTVK